MDTRGVSSPIGMVLIIGMTVAAVTTLVVGGGAVIDETRADAERSQMENAMSQFSSKASLVGLGESGAQQFNLGRASEGDVSVQENAGNVSVYIEYTDGGRDYISNVSMGSLVYQDGQTEIAYQGGGVWKRSNGYSTMVSPPEYHYRLETLTYPIISVNGNSAASGQVRGTIRSNGKSEQLFPNADKNANFTNPLEDGTVYVKVESAYCEGWEAFFKERSHGDIEETCDDDGAVVMDLTVPFDPAFGNAVTTKNPIENEPTIIGESNNGIVAPSADQTVEARINECLGDENCGEIPANGELTGGTYYTENGDHLSGLNIDSESQKVVIIVNNSDDNIRINDNIDITPRTDDVYIYIKSEKNSEINLKSEINYENNPAHLVTYVHSDVSMISVTGSQTKYNGGLYAPESELKFSRGKSGCGGNPHVKFNGSVVVENLCFKKGTFSHDSRMEKLDLDIEKDTIKYLHVSENTIDIEL